MTGSDELRALADGLRAVDVKALVSPVISEAGRLMRDRAKEAAPKGPHLKGYAGSIIRNNVSPLVVEVGAKAGSWGDLAAVLEFGQGPNAPHPHIIPQLEPEADVAAEWIARVIGDAL